MSFWLSNLPWDAYFIAALIGSGNCPNVLLYTLIVTLWCTARGIIYCLDFCELKDVKNRVLIIA